MWVLFLSCLMPYFLTRSTTSELFSIVFSVSMNVQAKKTKIRQHKHSSKGNSLGHLARILGHISHSCELKPCRSGHKWSVVWSVPSWSLDEFRVLPGRETLRSYPHFSALPVLVCSIGQKCNAQCYLGEKWEMNGTDKNARPKWNTYGTLRALEHTLEHTWTIMNTPWDLPALQAFCNAFRAFQNQCENRPCHREIKFIPL